MRALGTHLPLASRKRARAPSLRLAVVMRAVALGAIYAAIYKLITVETSFGNSIGATFWPASGVTVSMLVLRPRREWPLYLLAILIADFTMDVSTAGFTTQLSCGIAVANCAEPLLAASLLRARLRAPPDLSRLRELGLFYAAAAVAGPLLSAVIALLWSWVLGASPVWPFLGRWYVGDALGVVVIAPLIMLSLARPTRWALPKLSQTWLFGVVLIFIAVALPWGFAAKLGLPFMVIPALSVLGIRGGARAAAVGVFIVGLLVETLTAANAGPFAATGPFSGLLSAQMYLVACSASGLTAAALMAGLLSRDHLALHDSLTGLANRRLLMDRIAVALSHLARAPGTIGIVFIDLDGFKTINDDHGHAVGDRVLIETARRLESVVRAQDTIARIGGDEFVILVAHVTDTQFMPGLAARVRQTLTGPIAGHESLVHIAASIGYATTDRHDYVLARADHAMYAAKRSQPARLRSRA